jgi:hypothetical protein
MDGSRDGSRELIPADPTPSRDPKCYGCYGQNHKSRIPTFRPGNLHRYQELGKRSEFEPKINLSRRSDSESEFERIDFLLLQR